ncbi:hypothetical protein MTO96_031738, partial [Rhipicephalus appendiculatus]
PNRTRVIANHTVRCGISTLNWATVEALSTAAVVETETPTQIARACMNRCTNFNPYLMCQYLEFEFFKEVHRGQAHSSSTTSANEDTVFTCAAGGTTVAQPSPVTTGAHLTPVTQPTPVTTGAHLTPGTQPTPVNGYGPVWRAAVPSGVRSALRVEDTVVKSSG